MRQKYIKKIDNKTKFSNGASNGASNGFILSP
jgi:hypothetical protein